MQRSISLLLIAMVASSLMLVISIANAGVNELPNDIQKSLYNQVFRSQSTDWRECLSWLIAKNPPPWKIGYASSYAGNTWRAAVMDRLQNERFLNGKVWACSTRLLWRSVNDATQIQQIHQLVDQGVDAIIVCCSKQLLWMHLSNMPTRKALRYFRALDT